METSSGYKLISPLDDFQLTSYKMLGPPFMKVIVSNNRDCLTFNILFGVMIIRMEISQDCLGL